VNDPLYRIARYPAELIDQWRHADGSRLTLRPVLPQDAAPLGEMISGLAPISRRRRFHGAINGAQPAWLAQMTCVDYRRHLALVVGDDSACGERLVADARYVADDDGGAEFGLVVADRWHRRGVGDHALRALLAAAALQGLRWLHGEVLEDNLPMLALTRRLGFVRAHGGAAAGCVRVAARVGQPVPVSAVAQPWWRRLASAATWAA